MVCYACEALGVQWPHTKDAKCPLRLVDVDEVLAIQNAVGRAAKTASHDIIFNAMKMARSPTATMYGLRTYAYRPERGVAADVFNAMQLFRDVCSKECDAFLTAEEIYLRVLSHVGDARVDVTFEEVQECLEKYHDCFLNQREAVPEVDTEAEQATEVQEVTQASPASEAVTAATAAISAAVTAVEEECVVRAISTGRVVSLRSPSSGKRSRDDANDKDEEDDDDDDDDDDECVPRKPAKRPWQSSCDNMREDLKSIDKFIEHSGTMHTRLMRRVSMVERMHNEAIAERKKMVDEIRALVQ